MDDSLAIDLVHPHVIEVRESWAFPDLEIIVPYPLSLTYEIKRQRSNRVNFIEYNSVNFGDKYL
jgi:hypothetical protein